MKIKVNRTTIEVYDGANVRHALLKYFLKRQLSAALITRAKVYDEMGHPIDFDTPLSDGQIIKCKV